MSTLAATVAVLLTGCSVVFPLRATEDQPDALLDVQATDAPPPRCANGNDPTRTVLPAVADTILSSGSVQQNFGPLGVATVSADLGPMGSHGLFRFQLGDLDPTALLELRVILPSAMTSNDCGTGCGSCAGIEQPGVMRAFTVIDAWVESQATWQRASASLAWEAPGAAGAADRGPEIAAADHAIAAATIFAADPSAFDAIFAMASAGHLSVLVETTGAKQVVRTRENTCDGGAAGAQLELLGC